MELRLNERDSLPLHCKMNAVDMNIICCVYSVFDSFRQTELSKTLRALGKREQTMQRFISSLGVEPILF